MRVEATPEIQRKLLEELLDAGADMARRDASADRVRRWSSAAKLVRQAFELK